MGTVWDFSFQHWPWGGTGAAAGDETSKWRGMSIRLRRWDLLLERVTQGEVGMMILVGTKKNRKRNKERSSCSLQRESLAHH